jgi:hypothetical protein
MFERRFTDFPLFILTTQRRKKLEKKINLGSTAAKKYK